MDFRRSGQLDERRRRVLMDEIASPADADDPEASSLAGGGSAKGPVRAYSPAVLQERQPRVTDFLPVQPLWVAAALVLIVLGIAAIQTLHVYAPRLALGAAGPQLAALDSTARGSLAAWYSSAALAGAAALALLVLGIRAHRVDDYRGRYRVWLWTAAALAWLSLDAATGVHDALGFGLTNLAGTPAPSATHSATITLTWIAAYALVFGTLGLRLAIELWPSKVSFAALVVAVLLYGYRGLVQLEVVASPIWMAAGLVESTALMLAHVWLLGAVGIYARHVYLDATGRLKVHIDPDRKKKARKAKLKVVKADKPEAKPATDSAKVGQPAKPSAAPSVSTPKSVVSITRGSLTSPDDDDEDEDESYSDMSKSERRRLKKLARREQRRAA
jgi:hypothetical protein